MDVRVGGVDSERDLRMGWAARDGACCGLRSGRRLTLGAMALARCQTKRLIILERTCVS